MLSPKLRNISNSRTSTASCPTICCDPITKLPVSNSFCHERLRNAQNFELDFKKAHNHEFVTSWLQVCMKYC